MLAGVAKNGAITVEEIDEPVPATGQVLVRSLACGICGSDLHMLDAMAGAGSPLVMGHEFCGEILDYGPQTPARFATGTQVCSVPYVTGPGGPELVGYSAQYPGGFAQRLLLDVDRIVAVPPDLAPDHAALAEPLAVGLHAVNRARLEPGQPAIVVGCGPIGLAVISALVTDGHGPVIASDFSPMRRELAVRLGAHEVVDPAAASPYESWRALGVEPDVPSPFATGPRDYSRDAVVFECVGVPGMIQSIVDAIPDHGRVVVVGVCVGPDTIQPNIAIVKEVALDFVSFYTPAEFAECLTRLGDGRIDGSTIVTGAVGLDDMAAAFAELRTPDAQAKVIVHPG